MVARTAYVGKTDIRSVEPNMSRPGPSSCKEEVAIDMPVADEDDALRIKNDVVRRTQNKILYMVESALQIF